MRAEGGGNEETRMSTVELVGPKLTISLPDFSLQVVSDAFKGKVLLAFGCLN
jgi:hypothetical protein